MYGSTCVNQMSEHSTHDHPRSEVTLPSEP